MSESISQVLFGLDSVTAQPIPISPPPAPNTSKKNRKRTKSSTIDNKLQSDGDLVSDNSDNETKSTAKENKTKKVKLTPSAEGSTDEPADPEVEQKRLRKQRFKEVKALLEKRFSDDEMSRTIVVTNLPVSMKRREVQGVLGATSDELESIRFRNLPLKEEFKDKRKIGAVQRRFADDGRGMTAFVVFKNVDNVSKYLALTGKELKDGRHIFINKLKQNDEFSIFDRRNTVFVGRLPKNYLEENLYNTFKVFGSVANVRIVRDPESGESKCFGYVCFQNRASVDEALRGSRTRQVDGHPLRVLRCLKEIDMKAKMADKRAREREKLERQKKKLSETYDMSSMSKCKQRKLIRYGPDGGGSSFKKVSSNIRKNVDKANRRSQAVTLSNEKVLKDLKRKILKKDQ